jgi:glycosyltransferase involved in cell wall biosynthesis
MHFVADELQAAGHRVDLAFKDDLSCKARGRMRRLVVPRAVVKFVKARLKKGHLYDVVEVHEPIAAGYALARRFHSWIPPLLVCVYGLEARARISQLEYRLKKRLSVSWKQRFGSLLTTVYQANFALRNADHITVETEQDAEYLRTRLRIPADHISFLHGAASPIFFEDNGATNPTRSGILFLGTWIERKGILDLVPALIRVLEKHPQTPVTLAGAGAPRETVLKGFPPRFRDVIRVAPPITSDLELSELYRSHDILLLPSVFEGQPLSLLEAAAAGLAIVTTNTCGMKDFIRDGENGLLIEPGGADALTTSVLRLVEDPALAARLGAAAREKASTFSWRRSAEQFLAAAQASMACSRR